MIWQKRRDLKIKLLPWGFIIAVLLLVSVNPALSDETEENPSQGINSYIKYIPSVNAKVVSGEVIIVDSGIEYSYNLKAFDKLPIKFSLDTGYIGIKNTSGLKLPSHLTKAAIGIETTLPFFKFKDTYLCLGISPSFYTDDWAPTASAWRIPARSFIIYKLNARLTYLFGLAAYPDFEYEVYPVLGLIYQPNERLKFNLIPQRPNITYLVNKQVSLFTEFDLSNGEFEVRRNKDKNVVLRYKEQHLGLGLGYKFNKFLESSFSVGGIFNRSLRYRDREGKLTLKDSLYSELRLNLQF